MRENKTMPESSHPYTSLTPDVVLAALESAGYETDARIMALNSYENRVYQIGIEGAKPVIAKFYRPGRWTDMQIQEEHDFAAELVDLEIPVAAPLRSANGSSLHCHMEFRFAVFPCIAGRQPDMDFQDNLKVMGRYIGRVHLAGVETRFQKRGTLSVNNMAVTPREYLLSEDFIPPELIPAYESITAQLIDRIGQLFKSYTNQHYQRIHGDCHLGNVLWLDGVPHFVDFDDTQMGPVVQDIWMLLSGDRDQMQAQLLQVITGYNDFYRFPERQLELVESLRTLRIIHYAAWLARRWQDPAFPRSFPWFNTGRYWSDHVLEIREQLAALDEEPLRLY
ncbi:MAG: serine/threonine protein kinase [Pseudohongiellaceae bacterium]